MSFPANMPNVMNPPDALRPRKRSRVRAAAGRLYYTWRRRLQWWTDRRPQAKQTAEEPLPYVVAEHKTPLLRKLRDTEMQLQYNKIENLKIAATCLDSLLIEPGQYLSYWRRIGQPTYGKGYKDGMVLHYGTVTSGVGGGLCQLSNLLYWLTLHTSLTVAERHRHSYDVFPDVKRDQPFGSGATCVYNYRDLGIQNNTRDRFQLKIWLSDTHLHGQWLSSAPPMYKYRVVERDHRIRMEFWGGYSRHNRIFREVFALDGQLLDTEYITENHALMMYEPLLAEQTRG